MKRGIGFSTFMHGAGFTGSGEVTLSSVVAVEATCEGKVRILAASTEIGQGTNTIFSQIAADALHIDYYLIELAQPDTATVPNSGPTVASRTVMVVGKLVEAACIGLKQTLISSGLLKPPYTSEEFATRRRRVRAIHRTPPRFRRIQASARTFSGTTKPIRAMRTEHSHGPSTSR